MADEIDAETGVPIFSLYGALRAPTERMLDDIDVFVIDLQDMMAYVQGKAASK